MFANTTINPYYFVDFCEHNTRTRRLTSVGLAQAHPNYELLVQVCSYIIFFVTYEHRHTVFGRFYNNDLVC